MDGDFSGHRPNPPNGKCSGEDEPAPEYGAGSTVWDYAQNHKANFDEDIERAKLLIVKKLKQFYGCSDGRLDGLDADDFVNWALVSIVRNGTVIERRFRSLLISASVNELRMVHRKTLRREHLRRRLKQMAQKLVETE